MPDENSFRATEEAIELVSGLSPHDSVLLLFFVGMLTGTGGGVLRDILAGDMPYIFRKHIYASASLAGAGVFLLCRLILPQSVAALIGIAVVMIIRFAAAHFEWNLPRAQSVWKSE